MQCIDFTDYLNILNKVYRNAKWINLYNKRSAEWMNEWMKHILLSKHNGIGHKLSQLRLSSPYNTIMIYKHDDR